jgi:enoyl-CoA hydratase/carnithine racemase
MTPTSSVAGGNGASPSSDTLLAARNEAGEKLVLTDLRDDGVLTVTLNRPERANAWQADMELAYYSAFDSAVADPAVRAIVLTGTGKCFCAGADMAHLQKSSQTGEGYAITRRPQTFLLTVPKPVVAAVNGAVAGIGLIQAMMCDIRFASAPGKWTSPFSRLGLPAEDALAWRMQQVAGGQAAADVLLSSRVFTGAEAVELGLAKRAVAPAEVLPLALDYAAELAQRSPVALAMIKQQLLADAQQGVEASRVRSRYFLAHARRLADHSEGVAAFSQKRSPRFQGIGAEIGYLDHSSDFAAADLDGA